MSELNHATIHGITYELHPIDKTATPQLDAFGFSKPVEAPKPVIASNPFSIGDYVTIVTPKRSGHRVGQSGKIVAMTPSSLWDSPYMPQVYVEFATSAIGCGSAQSRVAPRHGCRMPVSGLKPANGA